MAIIAREKRESARRAAARRAREKARRKKAAVNPLQALWDANGAAIYKVNQVFKTAFGRDMDAPTREQAIKDATKNGRFNAGAYATNLNNERLLADYRASQERIREAANEIEDEKKIDTPDGEDNSYVAPQVDWKQQDYNNLAHAEEVAKASRQEKKSWWDKTVDWVDDHQAEVALGVGVSVGAAAIILSGGAATPLVAAAWMAGSTVVAGGAVALGTVAINNHYGRPSSDNIWRNIALAAGGAAITSGLGFLLAGGGLQAGVYKVGNSLTSACVQHPTACSRASSVLSLWDTGETIALRAKFAIQTAQGDPRAADTLLEIQLEQADGGMPGNTTIREITENITTLFGKHGDESLKLAEAFAHHGDEIAEIGENGVIRLKDDVVDFADSLNKIEQDLQDVNPNIRVYTSPKNGIFYVSQPTREALDASSKLKDVFARGDYDEIDTLIEVIANRSTRGSGNRVVLGAWDADGGYIGDAVENGGIFYDTGDAVWDNIETSGVNPWQINEAFLKNQLQNGVERIDFIDGDIFDVINSPDPKIYNSYRSQEIRWLLDNTADYGYVRAGNSWILP